MAEAPDIYVNSLLDDLGEVAAFEGLVSCHGGLGGWQDRGMVVHPVELRAPEDMVVGADGCTGSSSAGSRQLGHRQRLPGRRPIVSRRGAGPGPGGDLRRPGEPAVSVDRWRGVRRAGSARSRAGRRGDAGPRTTHGRRGGPGRRHSPSGRRSSCGAAYVVAVGYVAIASLLVLRSPRRRASTATALGVAAALALAGAVVASLIVAGARPRAADELLLHTVAGQGFPASGVAVLISLLLVLRSWMVLAFRRLDADRRRASARRRVGDRGGRLARVLGALALGMAAAGAALLVLAVARRAPRPRCGRAASLDARGPDR